MSDCVLCCDTIEALKLNCCNQNSNTCKDCLQKCISDQVNSGKLEVSCNNCDQPMDQDDMLGILAEVEKLKYLALQREQLVKEIQPMLQADEKIIFCPKSGCRNTMCTIRPVEVKEWNCGCCGSRVCAHCSKNHPSTQACPEENAAN